MTRGLRRNLFMLPLLWLCTVVVAQPTTAPVEPATTAPTSAPAADSTTPRGTLVLLSRATAKADTQTVLGLLATNSPREKQLADALMIRNIANIRCHQAIAKEFGEDLASQMTGSAANDEARVAGATEQITGDTAIVTWPEAGAPPINLVKQDGAWKLSLAGITQGVADAEVDADLAKMRVFSKVMNEAADELTAGKYKSPQELSTALQMKATAAMSQLTGAATRPSSAPTTTP